MREFIGIIAALARRFAHLLVAQIRQVGVIHLHVPTTRLCERVQFRCVCAARYWKSAS
jgi:hypothetical protein